jgi:hypothetical protein
MLVLYVRDSGGATLKRLLAGGATCVAVLGALYLPLWSNAIFRSTGQISRLYSSSSVPKLISHEYQKYLMHHGMSALRAVSVADGRVRMLFLIVMLAGAVVFLWGVRDFYSMALCASSLVLLWLLTSTYVLPWYVALGVMTAAITGWNLTTGLMIGSACILTLYRLPMAREAPGNPTLYTSLPLFILLLGWLLLAWAGRLRDARLKRAGHDVAGMPETSETGSDIGIA